VNMHPIPSGLLFGPRVRLFISPPNFHRAPARQAGAATAVVLW
jgi:hypothetical protein